jgi:hypothetical protein
MIVNLVGVFILGACFGALLAVMFTASSRRHRQWDRTLYQIQHQVDGLRYDLDRLLQRP